MQRRARMHSTAPASVSPAPKRRATPLAIKAHSIAATTFYRHIILMDVAGHYLPRCLQHARAALHLELCGMTLDFILANQPPTHPNWVLQSWHTHTHASVPTANACVQHLATQFALLLHQRSKLVTTAASWTHCPDPPTALLSISGFQMRLQG